MAQLHNREHYIIGERKRDRKRKRVHVWYTVQSMPFTYPRSGAANTQKKKQEEGKKSTVAESVKIAGSGRHDGA
ncbi:hypothetical protein ALC53_12147 [Atta colombica]|uniref:Uncharacterized protein n=1 Tax=Atta colombica TaxID=520822 RepID=A0A151HZ42_9HYME|nr:hypothetical protein ALC53_12147 [Atta colombica]